MRLGLCQSHLAPDCMSAKQTGNAECGAGWVSDRRFSCLPWRGEGSMLDFDTALTPRRQCLTFIPKLLP